MVPTGTPVPVAVNPTLEAPGGGIAMTTPQPTVLSVVTLAPVSTVIGPSPTPTIVWGDLPRRERTPLLGNFKLSLTPATLAVIAGLIILGAVLIVVYMASRRGKNQA
jgi:hypothetical protein